MNSATIPGGHAPRHHELTVKAALKWAWVVWAGLLAAPFLFLQVAIWYIESYGTPNMHANTQGWFVGAMAYLALVLPAAFFWRKHFFREYWLGRPVAPRNYIAATVAVGAALAIGGIVSLIGCLVTDAFVPNIIPGFLALVLFLLHWPTGQAMLKSGGHDLDEQHYEEPG